MSKFCGKKRENLRYLGSTAVELHALADTDKKHAQFSLTVGPATSPLIKYK